MFKFIKFTQEEKLAFRKKLAAPVYFLGWKVIKLADKIDGKQPRKKKAIKTII